MKKLSPLFVLAVLLIVNWAHAQQNSFSSREEFNQYLLNHPFMQREAMTKDELKKIPKFDRPDLAWEQDYLTTLDPATGKPERDRLFNTLHLVDQFKSNLTPLAPGSPTNAWVERGPNNVGGRTRALMWDPNDPLSAKVWAGGVTGGLWYNNNISLSTSQWQKVNDFWDNIAITCIAFDPTNTQTFYVGTGEGYGSTSTSRGAGLWKSTNGGATWTQISSTTSFYYVNDIVVRNEGGIGVVYAAVDGNFYNGVWHGANDAGLQRSTDGGATWTQVLPTIPTNTTNYVASDLEIGSNNRLWVGTRRTPYSGTNRGGGTILYSDNGTSWTTSYTTTVTSGYGRVELACAPNDANYVYAIIENDNEIHEIKRTVNGGSSWVSLSEPVDDDLGIPATDFSRGQAWYDLILAVDPNNKEKVIAGAINAHQTTNGGTSWQQISKWSNNSNMGSQPYSYIHADHHNILFKPGSSQDVIFGTDGGVFWTNNLSNAATSAVFNERNNGYNVTQFYAGAIHPSAGSNFMLAGAQDNGTQHYSTSGVNSTTMVTSGDGAYCFFDQTNGVDAITSYVYNNYYHLNNSGANYVKQILNDDENGLFINPADLDDANNILYSTLRPGKIYKVSNYSNTTPTIDSITITGLTSYPNAIKVSPFNNSANVFVGGMDGSFYRINNANTASPTFTNLTGASFPNATISSIEFGLSESQILVTFKNYGVNSVFYSSNGGASWLSKEGNLPDMPVRWGLINPNNTDEVILATEVGIWSTSDFSSTNPTWAPSNNGMANVRVDMLQYRTSDQTVMAATHGRGVFTGSFSSSTPPPTPSGSDTLYSFDFSNGLPAGWSNSGNSAGALWEYRGPNTTPNNTTGSRGAYTTNQTIQSETAANGFMIFDSDWLDNNGVAANFSLGINATPPHLGSLTTNTLDFTNDSNVVLQLSSYFRTYESAAAIYFSYDNGVSFPNNVYLHQNLITNQASANADVIRLNISQYVGGKNNVKIAFTFDGTNPLGLNGGSFQRSYYFWQIDDILLLRQPKYDLTLVNANSVLQGTNENYGQIPKFLSGSVQFSATIENSGSETATNARVHNIISRATGTIVPQYQSTILGTLSPATTSQSLTFTAYPINDSDDYHFNFVPLQDSADGSNFGDTIRFSTRVTKNTYALDHNFVSSFIGTSSFTGAEDGFIVANKFKIKQSANLSMLQAFISQNSVAGATMVPVIYDSTYSNQIFYGSAITLNQNQISNQWITAPINQVLQPGTYYFGFELNSFSGTSHVSVADDQVVVQDDYSAMIKIGSSWYTNGNAFIIRAILNPPINPNAQVTFRVDMSTTNVLPSGVYLAGNFNDYNYDNVVDNVSYPQWDPTGIQMTDSASSGIYKVTLNLVPGTYEYKFLNGNYNGFGGYWETVPSSCANATGNRQVVVSSSNLTTPDVCFNNCMPCSQIPTCTISTSVSIVDVSCAFGSDGEITLSSSGGNGPYVYDWGFTQSNYVNGLSAGIYTVTVFDAVNCTDTVTVTVNQPVNGLDAVLNGPAAVLEVTPTSGTPFFNNFGWMAQGLWGTDLLSSSAQGQLAVARDGNPADSLVCSGTIINPSAIAGKIAVVYRGDCEFGAKALACQQAGAIGVIIINNQAAEINLNGGLVGMQVNIPVMLVSQTLGANLRNLMKTGVSVYMGARQATPQEPTCFGLQNGLIAAQVFGGTAPYTYAWSNQTSGSTITNIGTGTYTLDVTDSKGCFYQVSEFLAEPFPLGVNQIGFTPPSTSSATDGSITVAGAGGSAPYTYAWNTNPIQNTPTATGLGVGNYTVTVNDTNNCGPVIQTIPLCFNCFPPPGNQTATTLYQFDFASGIPAGWTNSGTSANALWEYRGPATSPNNTIGSRGAYAGAFGPIQSPSAANGFLIFDSDWRDNAGIIGNFGMGTAPTPHTSLATTQVLNFSNNQNVVMSMHSFYRTFESGAGLVFSTDGGVTWDDTLYLHNQLTVNQATANAEEVRINISNFVGGQANVKIGFLFNGYNPLLINGGTGQGSYYFWQIDDIKFETLPANDIAFETLEVIMQGSTENYGKIPEFLLNPMDIYGNVVNLGVNTAYNVKYHSSYNWPTGGQQGYGSSNMNVLLPDSSTVLTTQMQIPQGNIGQHQLKFFAYSDSSDNFNNNDTIAYQVEVSTNIYALDRGNKSSALGSNSFTGNEDGTNLVNKFYFNQPVNLASIEVEITQTSVAGASIIPIIYDQSFSPIFYGNAYTLMAQDITNGTINLPVGTNLTAGNYFVGVELYSNGGANHVRVWDDETVTQYWQSSVIYLPMQGQWFSNGNAFLIRAIVNPPTPVIPFRSLATITTEDANGVADSIGTYCWTGGRVVSRNFQETGAAGPQVIFNIINLHNTTGISVISYDTDSMLGYFPKVGDTVTVLGTVSQFNGLTQFNADSIQLYGWFINPNQIPPDMVTNLTEYDESRLLRLNDVTLVNPSQWPAPGFDANVDILVNNQPLVMRIDRHTDIADSISAPTGKFSLIGVGSQFDATLPYTSGYQIFPRFKEDIIPTYDVTFRVNMSNETVDPAGVHIAGAFANPNYDNYIEMPQNPQWDPAGIQLTAIGNGVYETTINLIGGHIPYKFVNGNVWGKDEFVDSLCAEPFTNNRYALISSDTVLPTFCFASCTNCCANDSIYFSETICFGDSIFIAGAFRYNAGVYTEVLQNQGGCDSLIFTTLTVNPLPMVDAGNDVTICLNDTATLTATGASTYFWNTTDSTQSIQVSPTTTASYMVTGIDSNGCIGGDFVTVLVNPLPIVTVNGVSVCDDNQAIYALNGFPTGGMFIGPGVVGNQFHVDSVAPGSWPLFYVYVDQNGCANFDSTSNIVFDSPVIDTVTYTQITGCGQNNGSLNISVIGGTAPILYSLFGNYVTTPNFTNIGVGTYTPMVIDDNGCTDTYQAISFASPGAPSMPTLIGSNFMEYCQGDSVLPVTVTPTGSGTINWYATPALTTPIATGNTFSPPTVLGATTYYAAETNAVCVGPFVAVTIDVKSTPQIPQVVGGNTYCDGIMPNPLNAFSPNASINWYADSALTALISSGQSLMPFSIVGTYTYYATAYVTAGNNICESAAASTSVEINPIPAPPAANHVSYCSNGSVVNLQATPIGGGQISWYADAQKSQLVAVSPVYNPPYQVGTVTFFAAQTVNGCESQTTAVNRTIYQAPVIDSVSTLNASQCGANNGSISVFATGFNGILQYSINNGSSFTSSANFINLSTAGYPVVVKDSVCTTAAGIYTITAPGQPQTPSVSANTIYCDGSTIQPLTATAQGSGNLIWYNSPLLNAADSVGTGISFTPSNLSTGLNLFYVIENNGGCKGPSAAVSVTVNALPNVDAGQNKAICIGDTTTLIATGALTYIWLPSTFNDSLIVSPTTTSNYVVIGTDANNCNNVDTVTVTVNPIPVVFAAAINPVCEGSASITLPAGSPIGGSYSGVNVLNSVFNVSAAGVGQHPVVYSYTNLQGCTGVDTGFVTVNANPIVTFTSPGNVCEDTTTIALTGGLPSGGLYSGPGVVSGNFNAGIVGVGTYTLTYFYLDGNNCSNTATASVTVHALPQITWTPFPDFCDYDGAYSLVEAVPTGGTYTGTGVTSNQFDPALSGIGTFAIDYYFKDANGCDNTGSQNITVNPSPVVDLGNDTIVCNNLPEFILNAGAGASFEWFVNGVSLGATGQTFVVDTNSTSGTYEVVVTNSFGCEGTDTVSINVTEICPGYDDVTLSDFTLKLFPNPTSQLVQLQITGIQQQNISVEITNTHGQQVYLQQFADMADINETIDLAGNAQGLYLVRITTEHGLYIERLVIR